MQKKCIVKNDKIENNKLLRLFKLLNKVETRRFKKLLQSPFFTTNSHLLKLYDYLIKYYPDFAHPKLTKALIFTYLFPNRAYNDNKLRMLLREFTRLLEDFLVIKEVRENEFERKKRLVNAYGQRNEMDLFEQGTFRLLEEMKAISIKDKNHFFEQQQLIQNLVYHPATPKTTSMINMQTDMMEYLEMHYWSNKTWLSCNLLSTKQFYNIDLQDFEFQLENIPAKYLLENASLSTFYQAFQFLKFPTDEGYFQFKTTYLINIEKLDAFGKIDIYGYLLNYAVRRHNQGNLDFLKEIFDWNNIGLKYKLLVKGGRMDKAVFKNCCLTAIRLTAFDWVEKFIIEYQESLHENEKQDTIILCQANVYFYKKNYALLIETILNYRFPQFRDNVGVKSLLYRSYFELFLTNASYLEVFVAYSHAFEKYLRRNEFSTKNITQEHLKFIAILRKVAKLIHEKKWNTENQEKLKETILEEKIALKQWLLERISQINN